MDKAVIKTCVNCGRDVGITAACREPICGMCRGTPIPKAPDHPQSDIEQLDMMGMQFVDMSEPDEDDEEEESGDIDDE